MPRVSSATPDVLDERRLLTALNALNKGDFSTRLPTNWTGNAGRVADAFNDLAERLQDQTTDLIKVTHVVGKEGKITQRLSVGGASGSWAVRREAVNSLIDDLVHPTSEMARVIGAVADGDLSQRLTLEFEERPLQGLSLIHI